MEGEKKKVVGYVTQEQKDYIDKRAKQLGMTIGGYFFELAMWDNRHDLIPQLRKGGSITCNGNSKKA